MWRTTGEDRRRGRARVRAVGAGPAVTCGSRFGTRSRRLRTYGGRGGRGREPRPRAAPRHAGPGPREGGIPSDFPSLARVPVWRLPIRLSHSRAGAAGSVGSPSAGAGRVVRPSRPRAMPPCCALRRPFSSLCARLAVAARRPCMPVAGHDWGAVIEVHAACERRYLVGKRIVGWKRTFSTLKSTGYIHLCCPADSEMITRLNLYVFVLGQPSGTTHFV
jgi:hypothetical protein